jgi:hypothetical protein
MCPPSAARPVVSQDSRHHSPVFPTLWLYHPLLFFSYLL